MNSCLKKNEISKLRSMNFSHHKEVVEAEKILAPIIGEQGSEQRNAFNAKAQAWYYGEILKKRRKTLQITQKDLAERIGKERAYISRIEKGETDMQLSSFILIAEALNLRIRMEIIPTGHVSH